MSGWFCKLPGYEHLSQEDILIVGHVHSRRRPINSNLLRDARNRNPISDTAFPVPAKGGAEQSGNIAWSPERDGLGSSPINVRIAETEFEIGSVAIPFKQARDY